MAYFFSSNLSMYYLFFHYYTIPPPLIFHSFKVQGFSNTRTARSNTLFNTHTFKLICFYETCSCFRIPCWKMSSLCEFERLDPFWYYFRFVYINLLCAECRYAVYCLDCFCIICTCYRQNEVLIKLFIVSDL